MTNYIISAKVGKKANVCLMGINRLPVTLYALQWLAILDKADELRAWIHAHEHELAQGRVDDDGKPVSKATRL